MFSTFPTPQVYSLWDEENVNEVVADSLTELYRAFRKAKQYAKQEYPGCDFCQVDYDKLLKKAVVYIKQLPIRIDYVNDIGCAICTTSAAQHVLQEKMHCYRKN